MSKFGPASRLQTQSPGEVQREGWVERSETHRNVSAVSVGYGFA